MTPRSSEIGLRRTLSSMKLDQNLSLLVQFLSVTADLDDTNGPLAKRRRVDSDFVHEFITLDEGRLEVDFPQSHLVKAERVVRRQHCPVSVDPDDRNNECGFRILDRTTPKKSELILCVFKDQYDPVDERLGLAMSISHDEHYASNPAAEGRLWTDIDMCIYEKQIEENVTCDCLKITFSARWNFSTSYASLPSNLQIGRPTMRGVLERYFPAHGEATKQPARSRDFYNSAHTPDRDETIYHSLHAGVLETELYPFQKRAVQWFLRREGMVVDETQRALIPAGLDILQEALPLSFSEVTAPDGQICYISRLYNMITKDVRPFRHSEIEFRGGIAADEMGLGKTVEILALISLHKRQLPLPERIVDVVTGQQVRPALGTLIVCPKALLQQWISETQRHAPGLRYSHYQGVKSLAGESKEQYLERLASYDIVFCTYSTLAAEVHFAVPPPDRALRKPASYERQKSPLVELSWFRVCLDEAQMVEGGLSNPAKVARLIPRSISWAISGTPVKSRAFDLHGLLCFMRYEPFASNVYIWERLLKLWKPDFCKLFESLAIRHTKRLVRDEVKLPPQQRFVVKMPFSNVEEQHYQNLFTQMTTELEVDQDGAPISESFDPQNAKVIEQMRYWLTRLRQTALHPEIGVENRRALGRRSGPLRTIDEVLNAMIDRIETLMRNEQRNLYRSRLVRGQMLENSPRMQEALEIWTQVRKEVSAVVEECRESLRAELVANGASKNSDGKASESSDIIEFTEDMSSDVQQKLGALRNRLRQELEIEHAAIFYQTNGYFQIKTNTDLTEPDSDEFKDLEKKEVEGYELAKSVRREILGEILTKVNSMFARLSSKAEKQSLVEIPEFSLKFPSGAMESRRISERFEAIGIALDAQANQLDEWREHTVQLLLRPLVDEDEEGAELTGGEYEDSTKLQEEIYVFVQALRTVNSDRFEALTGQENMLLRHEADAALKAAKEGQGPYPEKAIALLAERAQIKPSQQIGSLRSIVSDLRALIGGLRYNTDKASDRAKTEIAILEKQLAIAQKQLAEQSKTVTALEKDVELFTTLMNSRLEYYRQLQTVSDSVAPYEGPKSDGDYEKAIKSETTISQRLSKHKSQYRYLLHLRQENTGSEAQRLCAICQEEIELGTLTECGHVFDKQCLMLWYAAHRNCPVCKSPVRLSKTHDITYKPQHLDTRLEGGDGEDGQDHNTENDAAEAKKKASSIYTAVSRHTMDQIRDIRLAGGPSFTTKIDTLCRHLIWLRRNDPGAKSIVFSQYRDFLDVLGRALAARRIGHASVERADGVERFRADRDVECFLLHARAHASGLNLAHASHVFLCEPLVNAALELQAVARVDRIGQRQATTVWLYLVDGSVEEAVYELAQEKRREHVAAGSFSSPSSATATTTALAARSKGKSRETTPSDTAAASPNTLLLDEGSFEAANEREVADNPLGRLLAKGRRNGEVVEKEDLRRCLFGNAEARRARAEEVARKVVVAAESGNRFGGDVDGNGMNLIGKSF